MRPDIRILRARRDECKRSPADRRPGQKAVDQGSTRGILIELQMKRKCLICRRNGWEGSIGGGACNGGIHTRDETVVALAYQLSIVRAAERD